MYGHVKLEKDNLSGDPLVVHVENVHLFCSLPVCLSTRCPSADVLAVVYACPPLFFFLFQQEVCFPLREGRLLQELDNLPVREVSI